MKKGSFNEIKYFIVGDGAMYVPRHLQPTQLNPNGSLIRYSHLPKNYIGGEIGEITSIRNFEQIYHNGKLCDVRDLYFIV